MIPVVISIVCGYLAAIFVLHTLSSHDGSLRKARNPFEYNTPVSAYEALKLIFFIFTLIPLIRAALIVITLTMALGVCVISTLGLPRSIFTDYSHPIRTNTIRKTLLGTIPFFARALLFIVGFHHIEVKGKPARDAAFITPNHVSFVDVLATFWAAGGTCFVAKTDVFGYPIFGRIVRALQIIPILRESKESREKTKNLMRRFAESQRKQKASERFPKIVIYPEGTTHAGSWMLMFQQGAFSFGEPVQGVAISFEYKHYNPEWLVARGSDFYLLRMFCQFNQTMKITFLPCHYPTEDEKNDAKLFAENVRKEIAKELGAKLTSHWYEDAFLYTKAVGFREEMDMTKINQEVAEFSKALENESFSSKAMGMLPKMHLPKFMKEMTNKIPASLPKTKNPTESIDEFSKKVRLKIYFLQRYAKYVFEAPAPEVSDVAEVNMHDVKEIFGDKSSHLKEISYLFKKFLEFDDEGKGQIDFSMFCSTLGLQNESPQAKNLFILLDRDNDGALSFKDLALGISFCSSTENSLVQTQIAFNLLDEAGSGKLSIGEFKSALDQETGETDRTEEMEVIREKEHLIARANETLDNLVKERNIQVIDLDVFQELVDTHPKLVRLILASNRTGIPWDLKAHMDYEKRQKARKLSL